MSPLDAVLLREELRRQADLDPATRSAIERHAARIARATPDPSPAQAARLRVLFNPPDLAERLALVDRVLHEIEDGTG